MVTTIIFFIYRCDKKNHARLYTIFFFIVYLGNTSII